MARVFPKRDRPRGRFLWEHTRATSAEGFRNLWSGLEDIPGYSSPLLCRNAREGVSTKTQTRIDVLYVFETAFRPSLQIVGTQ